MSFARPTRQGTTGRDSAGASTSAADVERGSPRNRTGGASAGASASARAASEDPGDAEAPRGRMSSSDWQRAGTLGAGLLIGALLGAGVALLLAPMSGEDTRRLIAKRARTARDDAGEHFSDLRDELRAATRRRRKSVRRGVTKGRWAVADLMDE